MKDMLLFWLAQHLVNLALALLLMLPAVFFVLRQVWRESMCEHNGTISETSACDAICNNCGKNLGFIGAWRNRKEK